uniref:Uncharacterized protein n=1 Tax=Drosophila melanogaster TaxID=7227 RepID=X2JGB2_DROME|nr:uncharacterized protein Dmel_CG44426 [Drosophila melanogaster]AHN59974.1 uncharacterized protein Dmel_CG44426 [Drosophila melanogaster]|eukprot:NP_001285504.1 uncharacterized protein Dmel_CG44426 [Drosophila melanogaster]
MGTSMEEDYRMQDATFCSCFHVFMAQIIAVINNNKNKMAGQDQDERIGSWFLRTGQRIGAAQRRGLKDELRDVDADAISTEFCSINDKL